MIYQLVNTRTEILEIATCHIAHLCNWYNHAFAVLIFMPRFNSINFHEISIKELFLQKKKKHFLSAEAPPPDHRNSVPLCRFVATRLNMAFINSCSTLIKMEYSKYFTSAYPLLIETNKRLQLFESVETGNYLPFALEILGI